MSIQFKRSSAINIPPEPAHLAPGELAINLADKKLYTKNENNQIINIGFDMAYANSTFLKLTGGSLSGPVVLFEGTMPSKLDEVVSKRYVDSKFGSGSEQVKPNSSLEQTYVKKTGDKISGQLFLTGAISGTDDTIAVNRAFTNSTYLKLTGGTVTGNLLVSAEQPSSLPDLALISRSYADKTYINATGDTMSGPLIIGYTPSAANHAVPKSYVDGENTKYYLKTGGDVSGPVTATGPITSTDASGLRIVYGSYGAMWHNNGTDFHLLFTDSGQQWGRYNDRLRPFYVKLSTGDVGMSHNLTVGGQITGNGKMVLGGNAEVNDVLVRSDKTLKSDFEPLTDALDKICSLSVSTYIKDGKDEREAGLIAQEVQEILPEAVAEMANGKLSIYPMGVIALLVKAVQELCEEVEELKKNQK